MKITIDVPNVKLFATAFNNAVAACGETYWSVCMGCEVSSRFESLRKLPDEELVARFKCLRDVYEQVEAIEKECY